MRVAPPKRMNVQNNAVLGINPSNAPQTPAPTETAAPISKPSQKESDIALLSDIDQDLDMMAFKHVALEGKIIDLVYSSDDVAVLCKLFSDPHTWTVDISQPVQDCVWTDETGATQRPCAILLAQKEALTKMEEEAQIIPTIVLMRGTIQNYQAVENYLLQNQISLVQYELQPGSEGKTLHDLLKEKFSIFSEDEEGEEEQEVDESENEADLAQDEEEDQEEIDTTSSPDEGIADENNDTQEVLQDDSENNT